MHSVTLSSKFQLSIPKAIREEMHLKAGQKFAIITKGDIISLVPIPDLAEMRGIAKGPIPATTGTARIACERYK